MDFEKLLTWTRSFIRLKVDTGIVKKDLQSEYNNQKPELKSMKHSESSSCYL